ncbi:hypothetical protein O988_07849 [Pseudogymnoascus sp. VKM F-3808]|nr:hypothetical protein O988_07849 [Pseudogymnoascus sp. VKM F-3808]
MTVPLLKLDPAYCTCTLIPQLPFRFVGKAPIVLLRHSSSRAVKIGSVAVDHSVVFHVMLVLAISDADHTPAITHNVNTNMKVSLKIMHGT